MAKATLTTDTEPKISVVYLHEVVQNPGIQGKKTLSVKDMPGLKFDLVQDLIVDYSLKGIPGGRLLAKSIVFEK